MGNLVSEIQDLDIAILDAGAVLLVGRVLAVMEVLAALVMEVTDVSAAIVALADQEDSAAEDIEDIGWLTALPK